MQEITGQKCAELKEINRKTWLLEEGKRVNAIEENCENSEIIYIGELKSVNELDTKETNCVWYKTILVNKNAVMFKLDTGSQVNAIPKSELLKWEEKPAVKHFKTAVLDYSDNRVPILGQC
ncbi:hypothetical protein TNCT_689841 [Trichonephila clavata]|uniref:Uncharacterized protein n=1 Tax=Trichonephila clavata TaxID=2740835 RepID=A0A8X6HGV1_TRICU|nr:hypothetical protein TNCT_689841 [Trichonephila clavata]